MYNLLKNQSLRIRQNGLEEIAKIGKGIRHECVLFLCSCLFLVFNVYIGEVSKEIKMQSTNRSQSR